MQFVNRGRVILLVQRNKKLQFDFYMFWQLGFVVFASTVEPCYNKDLGTMKMKSLN